MRLTCLVLIGLFVWGNGCLAAPDDDNGEVRLYVRAAYTGYHTRQTRSRGTGKTAPTTEERVQDKLTVVFQGTSTWRIKDWVPSDLTHNCAVSANGGGSWVETERGMDGCGNGAGGDHPYVSTDIGRWTYEVPAATKDYPPPMSPAGMVTVNPVGQWVLALFALANVEDLAPKGSWFNRYAGCKGTTQTDHPVDADNAPPPRSERV